MERQAFFVQKKEAASIQYTLVTGMNMRYDTY